jgi:hypothetical protein
MFDKNYYSKELLDSVDEFIKHEKDLLTSIMEAKQLAEMQAIRANAVVIREGSNAYEAYRKSHAFAMSKPMILGLDAYISKDLPEEYGFAVFEAGRTRADIEYDEVKSKVIDELREMPLSELAELLRREDD